MDFENGFVRSNFPSVTTCDSPARTLSFTSAAFDVAVVAATPSGPRTVVAPVVSNQNFTYRFPADAGTWLVDDLQENAGLYGPGLAFSWEPC
jgi:hypothetical protein